MNERSLTEQIIGAAIDVHKALGPGLLESLYEECMAVEVGLRGLSFERQKPIAIVYKGHRVAADLKIDLLVSGQVIVELKAVERLLPVHEAQLLTYLRLTNLKLGLLLNFNVSVLRDGIKRMANHFDDSAPPRLCGDQFPRS